MNAATAWVAVGLVGQFCYFMRFFVQWLATERRRQSVVPVSFWYFSIAGSLILLAYSMYRQDPVFILGQAFGVVVYLRNLYFIGKRRRDAVTTAGIQ
jgi:lipid-A-disaccharide synthase-like uncharacterized protein